LKKKQFIQHLIQTKYTTGWMTFCGLEVFQTRIN